MGYPIVKPPIWTSPLFTTERNNYKGSCIRQPPDPTLHPLFGIPITDWWPQRTEFQDAYCIKDRPRCSPQPCLCLPAAFTGGVKERRPNRDLNCDNMPRMRGARGGQALDQLYDPIPMPLVDKHYRGNYYRIDDPIGVITQEEVTSCRQTPWGPQKITTRDMMDTMYTPNYRYKEFVLQPQIDMIRQLNDTPSPVCRLPLPDTRHWDLYNQVRMNRPSPQLKTQFIPCRTIPIPRFKPFA